MDEGCYGICEVCHEAIERERLIADPLVRFCLDHLTAREKEDLEQDLQLAARVQRGLLPKPSLNRYEWRISYHYEPAMTRTRHHRVKCAYGTHPGQRLQKTKELDALLLH
jgi:hypothetical protein